MNIFPTFLPKTIAKCVLWSALLLPATVLAAVVACDGTTPCEINALYKTIYNAYVLIATIVLMYAFAKFAWTIMANYPYDRPEALNVVKRQLFNLVVWGAVLFGIIPLAVLFLRSIGVGEEYLAPLKQIHASLFVEHAYAQSGLPSPINVGNPYDYFLTIIGVFFRWIIVPFLIGLWVYSASIFVFAQGAPVEITRGKKYLWYSIFATVILMLVQTLFLALRGTINGIIS